MTNEEIEFRIIETVRYYKNLTGEHLDNIIDRHFTIFSEISAITCIDTFKSVYRNKILREVY